MIYALKFEMQLKLINSLFLEKSHVYQIHFTTYQSQPNLQSLKMNLVMKRKTKHYLLLATVK